jgi:hypothetical protein
MRVIKLPEVKPSIFEDFFIWLHTHEPRVKSTDMVAVFDLAIFADMYIIYDLMNQTSDVIRKALSDGSWQLTPDIVSRVYDGVPSGSILRQLCSSALTTNRSRQCSDLSVWKPVFEKCADLGWDYFRQMQPAVGKFQISIRDWLASSMTTQMFSIGYIEMSTNAHILMAHLYQY